MNREPLPNGCMVGQQPGRIGWYWESPKGYRYYNFLTKEKAVADSLELFPIK